MVSYLLGETGVIGTNMKLDIGGLEDIIDELRESVLYPLTV